MNLSSNNSKYSTVSSKVEDGTNDWQSKVDYEEFKDDFYFNHNTPLLQSKDD
jgi:hypothetical protein